MTGEQTTSHVYLRSIHTALIAVAVSVLTAGLIITQDRVAMPFTILSLLICAYAFVQPIRRK